MAQADSANTISRRSALALSVAALVVAPAIAVEVDPIFAAIKTHTAVSEALDAALRRQDELDVEFMLATNGIEDRRERSRQRRAMEAASQPWAALEAEVSSLHDAETEAVLNLIDVIPTTLAGAAVLLRHVVVHERLGREWPRGLQDSETGFDNEDWTTFLHRNIASVLEASVS